MPMNAFFCLCVLTLALFFSTPPAIAADGYQKPCPYNVGDTVYYTPDATGYSKMVMTRELEVGQAITITDIIDKHYLVWKDVGPTGGAHCDLFSAKPLKR